MVGGTIPKQIGLGSMRKHEPASRKSVNSVILHGLCFKSCLDFPWCCIVRKCKLEM